MILYEYAYLGGEITVREVECAKVGDTYVGVGVARHEDKLGELIGTLNVFLMYLSERDDMRFLRALSSRICDELLDIIKQTSKLNTAISKHLKGMAGETDD